MQLLNIHLLRLALQCITTQGQTTYTTFSPSLGTRPFAGRVWALVCIRVVPRTEWWPDQSESLIANYVMEMVFLQAFSAAND